MLRLSAICAVFASTLAVSPVFAADTTVVKSQPGSNYFGIDVSDAVNFSGNSGSLLFTQPQKPLQINEVQTEYSRLCSSLALEFCNPNKVAISAIAVLGPCQGNYSNPCIDSVDVTDKNGTTHSLTFEKFVDGPEFKGDASYNLPDGKTTSLWGSKTLQGTQNFSVRYAIEYGTKAVSENLFSPKTMSVSISPYVKRSHPQAKRIDFAEVPPSDPIFKMTNGNIKSIGAGSYEINCAWQENGICGVEQEFEKDFTYQIAIVIPKSFSGWLQGRLVSPEIEVNTISSDFNLMKVSAKAADVPRVVVDVDYSKKNEVFAEVFKGLFAYEMNSGIRLGIFSDNINSTKFLNAFASFTNNQANIKTTRWSFKNNSFVSTLNTNKCLYSDSKLMGMVTTNSLIYESGVPAFKEGFLEYKVAGLHLNPDGTEFLGAYDLILRSEAARCLYNFSSSPVSAEISVTGSEGEKKVATTRVSEENGWLHLGAYNFTFSEPTIKMLLKQEALVLAPNPSPSPSPLAQSQQESEQILKKLSKKITIFCIKGKQTRKISAVNPKCPLGYKKK